MVRIATVLGFLALALAPAASAAGPADVTRPADGTLRFCTTGYKCTARAVADFNGDKLDDLVFERARLTLGNASPPTTRQFDLHLSPFVADNGPGRDAARDRRATAVVSFFVENGGGADDLSAALIDGDGLADLVFTRAGRDEMTGAVQAQATVVLGRRSGWPQRVKVGGSNQVGASIVVERQAQPDDPVHEAAINGVALTAADLNQDGARDLVMTVDAQAFVGNVRRGAALQTRSDVYVQFARGRWPNTLAMKPDVSIVGLGACDAGLAGIGDVTGDGLPDLVVRRCQSVGAPPQLRVVAGRSDWPRQVAADGALPGIVPTPLPGPTAVPTAEPPPIGGGYLPAPSAAVRRLAPLAFVQDLNGDGVADIGLEFAGKTHLWHGGALIEERVAAGRTSGVYVKAGYGALPLTRTWRPLDLDADSRRDLLLSRPLDPALLACPLGVCGPASQREATGRSVLMYTGERATRRVVDAELDVPDAVWNDPANVVWALGEFNGDGREDLLLGSSPAALDSVYSLVYGPLAAAQAP
jgi:hypothetical protein